MDLSLLLLKDGRTLPGRALSAVCSSVQTARGNRIPCTHPFPTPPPQLFLRIELHTDHLVILELFTRTWRTLALSMFFHFGGGGHPTMEDFKTELKLLESSCLKGRLAGLFSRFSQPRPECSGPGFSSVEVTSSSEKACLRGAFSLGSLEVAAKECGPPG